MFDFEYENDVQSSGFYYWNLSKIILILDIDLDAKFSYFHPYPKTKFVVFSISVKSILFKAKLNFRFFIINYF